ncbi:MAG: response regulator [Solirubrobacteraceae bacterium]
MRVVIGEDEALLREGLTLVLEEAGIEVVDAAADGPGVVALVAAHQPDLVISDIRMPPDRTDDGLRAALEIRRAHPETAILILSHYVHRRYVRELLAHPSAGVGYLLKERVANVQAFCGAVRQVAEGGTVLDPEVVSAMLARARRSDVAIERLTDRQAEVLALVAQGRSNVAIARRLVISEKAVVQHVSRIYAELGLAPSGEDHRRVLAVARYLAH